MSTSYSGYTPEERETVINFTDADSYAEVYTAQYHTWTKLDKLCEKYPKYYKCVKVDKENDKVVAKSYKIMSKKLIRFGAPPKEYTEEEKEILRQRFAENLNKKDR